MTPPRALRSLAPPPSSSTSTLSGAPGGNAHDGSHDNTANYGNNASNDTTAPIGTQYGGQGQPDQGQGQGQGGNNNGGNNGMTLSMNGSSYFAVPPADIGPLPGYPSLAASVASSLSSLSLSLPSVTTLQMGGGPG